MMVYLPIYVFILQIIMTKLLEWLSTAVVLFGVWFSIVFGYVHSCCLDKWMNLIVISPIIFVGIFGIYAASVVLYRVFTFNDCHEAAKEIQAQILEARQDLKQKGFVFD